MKNTFKLYAIGWLAIIGLFNVITFVTPNEINGVSKFNALFWIGYAFIMLSFIAQLVCAYFVSKTNSMQKLFYSLSLVKINAGALIATWVAGTLCMAIIQLPVWIGIILCAIVLTFNVLAYVKGAVAISAVTAVDQKIKAQTMFIKMLTADATALIARTKTEEMKKITQKAYEAIRYSDPMSNDALSSAEAKIEAQFEVLSKAVDAEDVAQAESACHDLLAYIEARNAKCKILK